MKASRQGERPWRDPGGPGQQHLLRPGHAMNSVQDAGQILARTLRSGRIQPVIPAPRSGGGQVGDGL